jgi:hypothetical protein
MCPDFPNGHRLSLELAQWARLYACRNPCAITPVEFLDVSRTARQLCHTRHARSPIINEVACQPERRVTVA